MESSSLEKLALIKLLSSHGVDIINALSTKFVKQHIRVLIESLEKKSELYHLALGRHNQCFMNDSELRDLIITFIECSLHNYWNMNLYKNLEATFDTRDTDPSASEKNKKAPEELRNDLLLLIRNL